MPKTNGNSYGKITAWIILSGILAGLMIFFFVTRNRKLAKTPIILKALEKGKKQ
jgi:hypothetical protein